MNFEKNILDNVLTGYKTKKIHYESILIDEDTELDISDDVELLILNHSFGNNHTIQQYDLLKEKSKGKDFIILTSNYWYYKNKHPNIVYFPYYYFYFLSLSLEKFDLDKPRSYPLMCFNLNPWLHRTLNLLKMSKKSWFNDCKFSFHWTYAKENYDTTNISINTLAALTDEQKLELAKFKFPIIIEDNWHLGGNFYVSNQGTFYGDTYINYVTENYVGQEFITEKTWKPIFSGQLFYILGSNNIIQHLEDLGIDTFNDIINHRYDNETDLNKKIDLILNDLDRLLSTDLDELWKQTCNRRQQNLDLVYSQQFENLLTSDLLSRALK